MYYVVMGPQGPQVANCAYFKLVRAGGAEQLSSKLPS